MQAERGLTLWELVIALAILAVLFIFLVVTLASSFRLQGYARERDVAREAARGKLSEIIAWPDFATLTAFDGEGFGAGSGASTLRAQAGDQDGLPGEVEIDDANPDLVRATVRVRWNGVVGDETFEVGTLLTNPTPDPITQ